MRSKRQQDAPLYAELNWSGTGGCIGVERPTLPPPHFDARKPALETREQIDRENCLFALAASGGRWLLFVGSMVAVCLQRRIAVLISIKTQNFC